MQKIDKEKIPNFHWKSVFNNILNLKKHLQKIKSKTINA